MVASDKNSTSLAEGENKGALLAYLTDETKNRVSSGKAGSRQGSDDVSTSFLVSPAFGLTSFSHSLSHMKLSAVPGSLVLFLTSDPNKEKVDRFPSL